MWNPDHLAGLQPGYYPVKGIFCDWCKDPCSTICVGSIGYPSREGWRFDPDGKCYCDRCKDCNPLINPASVPTPPIDAYVANWWEPYDMRGRNYTKQRYTPAFTTEAEARRCCQIQIDLFSKRNKVDFNPMITITSIRVYETIEDSESDSATAISEKVRKEIGNDQFEILQRYLKKS
jgi:hypothetical protein